MTQHSFKMPNRIIMDSSLSLSARKIAAVLYAFRRGKTCTKSYRELGRIAHCAPNTVRCAVTELEQAGFISIKKNKHWDANLRRVTNAVNVYTLLSVRTSYTLIPYQQLFADLTAAELCVTMYLYCVAGQQSAAYPSINRIAEAVGIARSTVCKALASFRALGSVLIMRCSSLRGDFACNTYHLIAYIRCALSRMISRTGSVLPAVSTADNTIRHADGKRLIFRVVSSIVSRIKQFLRFPSRGSPIIDT